ncbi:MAG: hypothetical protein RIC55_28210 [Pirellulaceae bacterium]
MNMDSETLRVLMMEFLARQIRNRVSDQLQWSSCFKSVSRMARERFPEYISPNDMLRDEDGARLKHVIWDMIIERILIPGTANPSAITDGWPRFSITDYGVTVIEEQKPVPYDADGYLSAIRRATPTVNDAVIEYLAEAVGTFRTGSYLASAVMLGAASEMVFNELSMAIPHTLSCASKRDKLAAKMQRGKMRDRIGTVIGWCRNNVQLLPGTWSGDEQVEDIERIADLIRRRRNEAGHPENPPRRPSREQMYSYLMVFPEYCSHLYALMEWAKANPGCIV